MNRDAEEFLDSRIPVQQECLYRKDGDFLIVGDCMNSAGLMLNGTARQIYEMCDGKASVGDIIKAMTARYGAELGGRIRQDLYGILRKLEICHVLAIRNGRPQEQ